MSFHLRRSSHYYELSSPQQPSVTLMHPKSLLPVQYGLCPVHVSPASLGLSNKALEDCALCMEWLSSSPSMEQDVQCEGDVSFWSCHFNCPYYHFLTIHQQLQSHVALPNWVPDEACSVCTACNAPFTLIRKKHHCRSCGKVPVNTQTRVPYNHHSTSSHT